jgi:hypothetical protein
VPPPPDRLPPRFATLSGHPFRERIPCETALVSSKSCRSCARRHVTSRCPRGDVGWALPASRTVTTREDGSDLTSYIAHASQWHKTWAFVGVSGSNRGLNVAQIIGPCVSASRLKRTDVRVKVREVDKAVAIEIRCRGSSFERAHERVEVRKIEKAVGIRVGLAPN